jgi:hypothetical protein
MFSPGGYNRDLHGRPQARTLTATIVQRLVDECPMSESGHTRSFGNSYSMSGMPPERGHVADNDGRPRSATSCREQSQQSSRLFYDLVSAGEQRRRHLDAEQLGGSEINDQFGFGGLLDWQIGGLFALENPGGIDAN